jgi:hypothetical protein
MIKFFWGYWSDVKPIFGYRRKSYLVLIGLLGFLSYTYLSKFADSIGKAVITIIFANFCGAFNLVIGEALLVEISQRKAK